MAQDDLDNTILEFQMDERILNISYKPSETISSVKESNQATTDTTHFMVVSDTSHSYPIWLSTSICFFVVIMT